MESSTVTRWSRPPVRSRSLRPSTGRMSAVRPQTACDRLSLVETWTVRSAPRIASSTTAVSGAADAKLPPIPTKTRALPSRSARTASTVSNPCSRGGSKWNSSRNASRKWSGTFSQIPIVRSPWTFECPRTGQSPAPGLPMLPCAKARLAISLIVATALRCWVIPMAQQVTVRFEVASRSAACSMRERSRPVATSTASQSSARMWSAHASNPVVCLRMNSRSRTVPGRPAARAASSLATRSEPSAWNSARSPHTRTGRCRSASSVPTPDSPRGVWGLRNRARPASASGLTAMIVAPRRFAISSALSMRGWLVPGFWPTMRMSSALWTSSRLTLPLPMPMTSARATDVDSWHMFEQSGRLLVPNARTNSW